MKYFFNCTYFRKNKDQRIHILCQIDSYPQAAVHDTYKDVHIFIKVCTQFLKYVHKSDNELGNVTLTTSYMWPYCYNRYMCSSSIQRKKQILYITCRTRYHSHFTRPCFKNSILQKSSKTKKEHKQDSTLFLVTFANVGILQKYKILQITIFLNKRVNHISHLIIQKQITSCFKK